LSLRNPLADLILASLHDAEARRALDAVATLCIEPRCRPRIVDVPVRMPREFLEETAGGLCLKSEWSEHAADLRERSSRASRAIDGRPLDPPEATLESALDAAALLFDAGLYFEVHELLESYWLRTEGSDRIALQGLIQIAVGLEHLVNDNLKGAHALLASGCDKMEGRPLSDLDLDRFARDVRAFVTDGVALGGTSLRAFDRAAVPRFPCRT
jgi:predicted metal-dependent hydrolase